MLCLYLFVKTIKEYPPDTKKPVRGVLLSLIHIYVSNLQCTTEDPLTEEEMASIATLERNNRLVKGQVFLWEGANAVSYTHLDVYKRQVFHDVLYL